MDKDEAVKHAVERVLQLEAELEAEGAATTGGDELARIRERLHEWVDTVVAAIASPGVGRVTLVHQNGQESKIASPSLPFLLARPVSFGSRNQT